MTPHVTEMIAMGERVDFAERLLTQGRAQEPDQSAFSTPA